MRSDDLRLLDVAEEAARAGVDALRSFMDLEALENVRVETKALNDFVTAADLRAQEEICAVIMKAFPSHEILGEEEPRSFDDESPDSFRTTDTEGERDAIGSSGIDSEQAAARSPEGRRKAREDTSDDRVPLQGVHRNPCWIIDPLDGTTNFIHGYPVFAVSVACWVDGRIRAGVVIDPSRNEVFRAARHQGAYLGERRLHVSKKTSLDATLIATGFPFRRHHRLEHFLGTFRAVFSRAAGIRRAGSAALDLAQVACGRFDAFWEEGLGPWDISAGALLIEEAGGRVGDFLGGSDYLRSGAVIAAPPAFFDELQQIVHRYQQDGISPPPPFEVSS